MKEIIFELSSLIKNKDDKSEIEFWGHDAGEFVPNPVKTVSSVENKDESQKNLETV